MTEQIWFARFETHEVSAISGQWWQTEKDTGEEDLAPLGYRIVLDAHLPLHNDTSPPRVRAICRHVKNPESLDELTIDKGEVLEAWDNVPGWWNAKKGGAKTGVVPSPYFILDVNVIRTEVQSVALKRQPPKPFPARVNELSLITRNQNNYNMALEGNPSDLFGLLDHLAIAETVLAASDESTPSSTQGTATALHGLDGEHGHRGKLEEIETSALSLDSRNSTSSTLNGFLRPQQIEADDISKEPLRFVSQTEFQSILLSFSKESVIEEKRFEISQANWEAWINWVISNPGDDDLNVFEIYGLEDEICSAVLPRLLSFEGEQWGNRDTGAVLDAWVREAVVTGSMRESVQHSL